MTKNSQLVDLKTAIQAKENGFNGGCLYYYDNNKGIPKHHSEKSDSIHPLLGCNFNHRYSNEVGNKYPISAPTKEQYKLWQRK